LRWYEVRPGDVIQLIKYNDDDWKADEPYIEQEVVTIVVTEDEIFNLPQKPPELPTAHEPGMIAKFHNDLKYLIPGTRIETTKTPYNEGNRLNSIIFPLH
jgi:hypothetical protein